MEPSKEEPKKKKLKGNEDEEEPMVEEPTPKVRKELAKPRGSPKASPKASPAKKESPDKRKQKFLLTETVEMSEQEEEED